MLSVYQVDSCSDATSCGCAAPLSNVLGSVKLLGSLGDVAYSKFMTTFLSSAADDIATVCRTHSLAESVFIDALAIAWLIRAFHNSKIVILKIFRKTKKIRRKSLKPNIKENFSALQ